MINILFTSAGRRNYLLHFFKDALKEEGNVFAADVSSFAPTLREADKAFVVPLISDPSYVDTLLDICVDNAVSMLIPLNDLELPILANNIQRFLDAGIFPLVSSSSVVDTCFDKLKTVLFLEDLGLRFPKTFLSISDAEDALRKKEISFPLIIKPRWGSASIGIAECDSMVELRTGLDFMRAQLGHTILANAGMRSTEEIVIIQEKLCGQEYGLDIINDLEGNFITTIAKKKLSMRAGETDKAVTVEIPELLELGRAIGNSLKHLGNLDCDVFYSDGCQPCVLEMNPRFGGGYPFSHVAGANLPGALIAWLKDEKPNAEFLSIQVGVSAAKCDRLVVLKKSV